MLKYSGINERIVYMLQNKEIFIPDLGKIEADSGFLLLDSTEDKRFFKGKDGVELIASTGDGKVEFVSFGTHTLAAVKSAVAFPVYYPVYPVKTEKRLKEARFSFSIDIPRSCFFTQLSDVLNLRYGQISNY